MPLPRSSKEKSRRIDWGYFNRPSKLSRVRTWLWIAALVLVTAPLAAATVAAVLRDRPPAPMALAASRGPLSSPHAAWDNQCEACHEPFTPIGSDRWLTRLVGHDPGDVSRNTRCESCHSAAVHHPAEKPGSTAGCADCHREHGGRDLSLVRLSDQACVRCHGNLAEHHANPSAIATAASVTGFAADKGHREFRAVDPSADRHQRTLKFSHAVHMAPGLGLGQPFTFEQIADEAERAKWMARLGATDRRAAVQLGCAACHEPEVGGGHRPVVFENHCQSCHPLTFDEAPDLRTVQAPHHVQPDELERFLRRIYTEKFVTSELKALKSPDRGPGRLDPPPEVKEAARGKIDAAVTAARQTLLVGRTVCLECHNADFPTRDQKGDPRVPTRIRPAAVPANWMHKARFDHHAHRAMDCSQCHPGAYRSKDEERNAANQYSSPGTADRDYQHPPDLPGIATCTQCHSPAGGVRHGCTDCHGYHHVGRKQPNGAPANPFRTPTDWLKPTR